MYVDADEETILAALLHDIGQFSTSASQKQMFCEADDIMALDPTALINTNNQDKKKIISVGVTGHERIGAEYLRRLGFSQKVTQLVESHVPVKRYLTGKYADYYDSLSAASKLSLKYQASFSMDIFFFF
jgi:putative nucleotidyltransferase with HDIG domain